MDANIWFDGACAGNPGPMGAGAVLEIEGTRRSLHAAAGRGTNNEAEYEGLLLGLRAAKDAGVTAVTVYGDSQLIIRQLEGRYQVKAAHLRPRYQEAKRLLEGFDVVRLKWIRREENVEADAAANRGIGR